MVPMVEVVSIPVPREGNDTNASSYLPFLSQFQSPFPVRGTTRHISAFSRPCAVSIPVPLAGNDDPAMRTWILRCMFQSPFPSRGTTYRSTKKSYAAWVSIPVPLAGNDFVFLPVIERDGQFQSPFPSRGTTRVFRSGACVSCRFNPRSPRGERQKRAILIMT